MSKMIRVSSSTYDQIEEIQSIVGSTKQDIVKKAIDKLSRELLIHKTDLAFKKLKKNKKAWQQELKERSELDFLNDELRSD
jgi:hypothetical protein